jgi:AhpD family alkylhydroperoxidase
MDETTKELVAMGAAVAVNCKPCLEHHLAACERLRISRGEVRAAVEVGQMVNRGAASKTRAFADELLGAPDAGPERPASAGGGACCD